MPGDSRRINYAWSNGSINRMAASGRMACSALEWIKLGIFEPDALCSGALFDFILTWRALSIFICRYKTSTP